jgi:hypothetical protein
MRYSYHHQWQIHKYHQEECNEWKVLCRCLSIGRLWLDPVAGSRCAVLFLVLHTTHATFKYYTMLHRRCHDWSKMCYWSLLELVGGIVLSGTASPIGGHYVWLGAVHIYLLGRYIVVKIRPKVVVNKKHREQPDLIPQWILHQSCCRLCHAGGWW